MRHMLLTIFLTIVCTHSIAKGIQLKGEFAQINVHEQNSIIKELLKGNNTYIAKVIKAPNKYSPPVLYVLSHVLFKQNQKNEAMFWLYAAEIRAKSDANKSLDKSTQQAVKVLNRYYGPSIDEYAIKNIVKLKDTLDKVIIWDAKTQRSYDPKWISLHGMDALTKTKIAFEPKEKWNQINTQTRNTYVEDFRKAIKKWMLLPRQK